MILVDDDGYVEMLTRLDKDGKRISEKQGDILELENNVNLAIVETVQEISGKDDELFGEEEEDEEDEEEEKENEKDSMERKRKTTFSNLKSRAMTGFNKRNPDELAYVSRKTFLQAGAVFADAPPVEMMLEANKKNMEKANKVRKRKTTLGTKGFQIAQADFGDMNDLNNEIELEQENKIKDEEGDKDMSVISENGDSTSLNQSALNSEAYSELNESLVKLKKGDGSQSPSKQREKNEIIDYIIKNREVTNQAVRSAEINVILYRNLSRKSFSELNTFRKILTIMNFPISILTYITVLPTTEEGYTKWRYLLNPAFGFTFVYFIFTYLHIYNIYIFSGMVATGVILSILFSFVLIDDKAPTGKLKQFFMFLGFITAFCWLFFLSDILVSVIKALNVLFNYQYTFMMISSFSFCTWVPMLLGSIRIVALMKEMPSFSGIMFNSYFVFGVGILVQTLAFGRVDIRMWPKVKAPTARNLFFFLCLNLLVFVGIGVFLMFGGMRYNRVMGLVFVYGYLIVIVGIFVRGIFAKE